MDDAFFTALDKQTSWNFDLLETASTQEDVLGEIAAWTGSPIPDYEATFAQTFSGLANAPVLQKMHAQHGTFDNMLATLHQTDNNPVSWAAVETDPAQGEDDMMALFGLSESPMIELDKVAFEKLSKAEQKKYKNRMAARRSRARKTCVHAVAYVTCTDCTRQAGAPCMQGGCSAGQEGGMGAAHPREAGAGRCTDG